MANYSSDNPTKVLDLLPIMKRAFPGMPGYLYVGIHPETGEHLYSNLMTPAGCPFAEWEWRTKVGGKLPYRFKITLRGNK